MSELSVFIENLKNRASGLEGAMNQLFAQHNQMQGHLKATQEFIEELTKIANVVAPSSPVTEALNLVDNAVNMIDNVMQPTNEATQNENFQ